MPAASGIAGAVRNANTNLNSLTTMNEYLVGLGVLVIIGVLSIISEIRTSRKRLESATRQIEQVLVEIRDALKTRS